MHVQDPSAQPHLARIDRIKLLWSIGLSLFWVVFLWGFFERDVYALGANAFVFLAATMTLFLWAMLREGVPLKKNLFWIVPIFMIALGYLLYDNPFLKVVSVPVLAATFILFYNDAFMTAHGRARWDAKTVEALVWRSLSVVTHVRKAGELVGRLASRARRESSTAKRVATGIVLFLLIAAIVVIPLLSSADAQFAATMGFVNEWIKKLFSTSLFGRILVFFLLSVFMVAALLAWARPFPHSRTDAETKHVDSIVIGIVLGGMLALYGIFLWIQLGNIWVGKLPVEFSETERLVKDGFWQLIFLTVINVFFTFIAYRKTVQAVQHLLIAFVAASLLLLASAGQRMTLYATYYGLSYEKFFASYAVVFCAILLIWLVARLCMRGRADVIKFSALLFLWMYAVLTVMPVEQIILRSNVALSKREGSQIRLFELTMLSPDVLDLVRKYQREGVLEEKNPFYTREASAAAPEGAYSKPTFDWNPWIKDREQRVSDKKWYELNVTNLLLER